MSQPPNNREALAAAAQARKEIEEAIATLKAHRDSLTEGQIKELKRIIYSLGPS